MTEYVNPLIFKHHRIGTIDALTWYRQQLMTGRSGMQKTKAMTTKQRSVLVNFNRVLIFALTLTGLLMDGYQHSDLPVTLALGIWLWLAVCTRMEANILSRARHHPASSRNRAVRLRGTAGAHHTSAKRWSGVANRKFWQRRCNATIVSQGQYPAVAKISGS